MEELTLFHSLKSGDSSEILQDLTNTTSFLVFPNITCVLAQKSNQQKRKARKT